jgi:hypothetical protein
MSGNTTVKQYRTHLELPNASTIQIVSDDLAVSKEIAQSIMKGGCRFDPAPGSPTTLLVYHSLFEEGKTPLGWISQFEVPAWMSNKATTEKRIPQAA